jgi:hypothetical protein
MHRCHHLSATPPSLPAFVFGRGALNPLAQEIATLGSKKALIIST